MSITCPQQGNFDGITCGFVGGWAWDGNTPNVPVSVDVYDGATLIATVPANQYRADLALLGFGNGVHGFSFATPTVVRDGQLHTVSLRIHGSGMELPNSPRQLTCSGQFYALTPCRVIDTRGAPGPYGAPALTAGATRSFTLAGQCGVPASAQAVAMNLTATNSTVAGSLVVFPGDVGNPGTSTLSFNAGQTPANNAIIGLSSGGTISVLCNQPTGTTDFIPGRKRVLSIGDLRLDRAGRGSRRQTRTGARGLCGN